MEPTPGRPPARCTASSRLGAHPSTCVRAAPPPPAAEYAEQGVLRDRLLLSGGETAVPLSWSQRVRVALDVAEGLRYLHEYADPPCVHMGVSSGCVLLAGSGPRAKLRGFAAARAITGRGGGGELVFTMTSRIAGTRRHTSAVAQRLLKLSGVSGVAEVAPPARLPPLATPPHIRRRTSCRRSPASSPLAVPPHIRRRRAAIARRTPLATPPQSTPRASRRPQNTPRAKWSERNEKSGEEGIVAQPW